MSGSSPARVALVLQTNPRECGAACLAMVLGAHGIDATLCDCRRRLRAEDRGVSAASLVGAARRFGLRARGFKAPGPEEVRCLPLPAIAHWGGDHYVVIDSADADGVSLLDPSLGRRSLDWDEFSQSYAGSALTFEENDDVTAREPLPERPSVARRIRRFLALPAARRGLGPLALGALLVYALATALPLLAGWVLDHRLQQQLHPMIGASSSEPSGLVVCLVALLVMALLGVGFFSNRLLDLCALRFTNLLTSPPALDAVGLPQSLAGDMDASTRHLVWHAAYTVTRHVLLLWIHGAWVVLALLLVAVRLPVLAPAALLAVGAHALLLVGGTRARIVEFGREASAGSDPGVRAGHLLLSTSTERDRRGVRGLALGALRVVSVASLAWLAVRLGTSSGVPPGTVLAAASLSVQAVWPAGAMALAARRLAAIGPRIDAVDMAITTSITTEAETARRRATEGPPER